MRKIFYFLFFLLLINVQSQAQTKKEKQVAAAVEQLKLALITGDRAQLDAIAAEQLSYGHSSGALQDKAAFIEALVSKKSDFVSIDLSDQTIQISGKTAIVRHYLSAKTADGGKPGTVDLWILLVFQKQHGDWKLLARQAVKLPK